jgi:hypothetical protein
LYRSLMSRSYFWDRGPFLGYAVPQISQPRVTLRFKAVHNNRAALRFNLSLIDKNNTRHDWHPEVMFKNFNGDLPLGGPNTIGKDFEWGFDLTQLVKYVAGDKLEEFIVDLQNGKNKLEIDFSEIAPPKDVDYQGELKESELKFWNEKDQNTHNVKLLAKPISLKTPVKITSPITENSPKK